MTHYIQNPVLWALLVAVLVAVALIVRQRRAARALRQEIAGLRSHYSALENEYAQSVEAAQEQAEQATKTVLKSAMRTLQGLAAEQQLIVSRLQNKYGESVILQDLLEIDHTNSQFGRRAQSIAVLCDGWLGRARDVASVYDVVRSAQGRVRHYRRVEILSQVDFGITSRAVEPVALALAELLDNATSYSSPDTVVEINIRTVPKGICIVVDDAGVGMNDEERARAEKLLSSQRVTGVSALGNPPQFGFAVIGVLSERFGFEVSVDSTSPTEASVRSSCCRTTCSPTRPSRRSRLRSFPPRPPRAAAAPKAGSPPVPPPPTVCRSGVASGPWPSCPAVRPVRLQPAPARRRRRSWAPSSGAPSRAGPRLRIPRKSRAAHVVLAAKGMRSRERRSVMDA